MALTEEDIKNKLFDIMLSEEEKDKYAGKILEWYNHPLMMDNARKKLVEENLPWLLTLFTLGLHINGNEIMKIRCIVNALPV